MARRRGKRLRGSNSSSLISPTSKDVSQRLNSLPNQREIPVVHHFGPGIYIREVTLPPGTMVLGHCHRYEHLCILQKGTLSVIDGTGSRRLTAPMIFTGPPGSKLVYAHDEVVFQNVFATEETDIETLEDTLVDKTATDDNALLMLQLLEAPEWLSLT